MAKVDPSKLQPPETQNPMPESRPIDAQAIMRRILEGLGLKKMIQLASILRISQAAISEAHTKKAIPSRWIVELSSQYGLSPTWLLYGIGPKRLDELTASHDSEREEFLAVIRLLFEARYPGHTITQHAFKDSGP